MALITLAYIILLSICLPGNNAKDDVDTFQIGGSGAQGQPGQSLEFTSYSQIPESLLDHLSSEQRKNIRDELMPKMMTMKSSSQKQMPSPQQPAATQGGPGQNLEFSSYSQIPESVLDQLPSEERKHIREELMPKMMTMKTRPQKQMPRQPPPETEEFSSYSEIPDSVLDFFSPEDRMQIKETFYGDSNNGQSSYSTYNRNVYNKNYYNNYAEQNTFSIPGGHMKRITNLINTLYNYVYAGGFLSGIPAVDLLLLRLYLNDNPKKFCPV